MSRFNALLLAGMVVCLLAAATPAAFCAEGYSLDDLTRIALARSERLKVAEENITIAEIGTDKARSFLLSPRYRSRRRHPVFGKEAVRDRERHPAGNQCDLGGPGG